MGIDGKAHRLDVESVELPIADRSRSELQFLFRYGIIVPCMDSLWDFVMYSIPRLRRKGYFSPQSLSNPYVSREAVQ